MRKADTPLLWLHGEIKTPPVSSAARIEAGGKSRLRRYLAAADGKETKK